MLLHEVRASHSKPVIVPLIPFWSALVEMPESFYKLSPNEIKALYKSHVDRRENLENK